MDTCLPYAFITGLFVAAVLDVRTGRIPNDLSYGMALAALAGRLVLGGGDSMLMGLAGLGLCAALVLPLFARRSLGGGDAKLLMAVGVFLGPAAGAALLLWTAVCGALQTLLWVGRQQGWRRTARVGLWCLTAPAWARPYPPTLKGPLPLAPSIFLAALLVVAWPPARVFG